MLITREMQTGTDCSGRQEREFRSELVFLWKTQMYAPSASERRNDLLRSTLVHLALIYNFSKEAAALEVCK